MKVFLPTIAGLVPSGMLHAITAFLNFCYLVWHSQIDESVLDQIDDAVNHFHWECHIFIELGIWDNFLLPCQYAIVHYHLMIQLFGAPNGLCLSITESKHIKAVKQPYRCSSWNNPLGEMILTNQWNDKLATAQVDFESYGMLMLMCWHSAGCVLNKTNTSARCCINACKCCDRVSDSPQHVCWLHKWEIRYEMKWGELRWCSQSQKLRMSMRARTQMRMRTKRSRNERENFLYSIFIVYRLYETISQRLKVKKKEKCTELNKKA